MVKNRAPLDARGNPATLGAYYDATGQVSALPVRVDATGNKYVINGSRLKKSIVLDLSNSRQVELVDESFSEITAISDGKLDIYFDRPDDEKRIRILDGYKLNIAAICDRFYISNAAQSGKAVELWLFE